MGNVLQIVNKISMMIEKLIKETYIYHFDTCWLGQHFGLYHCSRSLDIFHPILKFLQVKPGHILRTNPSLEETRLCFDSDSTFMLCELISKITISSLLFFIISRLQTGLRHYLVFTTNTSLTSSSSFCVFIFWFLEQ